MQILHGYGDLPDDLIIAAETEVAYVLPDNMASLRALCLIAPVLRTVESAGGEIEYEEVLEHVKDSGLIPDGMTLAELTVYSGVVNIAHYLGRAYYAPNHATKA